MVNFIPGLILCKMSSNSVCRLCLATDGPMHPLVNTPLQHIYEKLTNILLITTDKPVAACYLCYYQLMKTNKLMTSSLKADELLTQILQSGTVVNKESVSTIDRKAYELNDSLTVTPVEPLVVIPDDLEMKVQEVCYPETGSLMNVANIKQEKSEEDEKRRVHLDERRSNTLVTEATTVEIEFLKQEDINLSDDEHWTKSEDDLPKNTQTQNIPTLAIDKRVPLETKRHRAVMKKKLIRNTEHIRSKQANKVLESTSSYLNNIASVSGKPVSYNCNECGSIFNSKYLLIEHNIINHDVHSKVMHRKEIFTKEQVEYIMNKKGADSLECGICFRKFAQKCTLKIHLRTHTGEKPFQCKTCLRRFNQTSHLKTHLKIHSDEKPYECEVCQKNFSRSWDLTRHYRIHTGEKLFECKICLQKFSQRGNLNIHVLTHSPEKPFQCALCPKRFCNKRHLKLHLRIHTGEQPYQCSICLYKFTQKGHLEAHLRTHTGEKPFECVICSRQFRRNADLKRHIITHGEIECEIDDICNKVDGSSSE